MKIPELLAMWEKTVSGELTDEEYSVRLPLRDAARLQALAELYPRRDIGGIITDLLSSALDEVESSLPYICGDTVVARDEMGDPLYEDIGPTPKYLSLTRKHLDRYMQSRKNSH